jgi:NTF2 fold immunity protein
VRIIRCTLSIVAFVATLSIGHQSMSQSECDPVRIAEEFIEKRFPLFDATGKRQVVSEEGSLWVVTYELPPYMLGGAPVVTIDKRTCQVVRAYHTQ